MTSKPSIPGPALVRLDAVLTHLHRALSTPAGPDAALGLTSYTSILLSALLTRHLQRRAAATATAIAAAVASRAAVLNGEKVVASLPAPTTDGRLERIAAGAKALAGLTGEARTVARLWGLLGIYMWGRGTVPRFSTTSSSTSSAEAEKRDEKLAEGEAAAEELNWRDVLAAAQILACAAFQLLENGAYLADKGVLTSAAWRGEGGQRRIAAWYKWSARCWAAHVGLEIVRLGAERWTQRKGVQNADGGEEAWKWRREMLSNLSYAPMTLHYSIDAGLVSEAWVGLLGTIASGVGWWEIWKATE